MKRNPQRMKYQPDKVSYWFCILSIVINMVYFVSVYSNRSVVPDVAVGTDVLINIIFMMVVFLASEKLKGYTRNWNKYISIVGVLQILRIFWLPMHYNKLGMLEGTKYILTLSYLITSGVFLIIAGINATINQKILNSIKD